MLTGNIANSTQNPVLNSLFLALRLVTRRNDIILPLQARKKVQDIHARLYRLIEARAAAEAEDLMAEHVHGIETNYPKMTKARQKK